MLTVIPRPANQARLAHKKSVEIAGRGEVERRTRGLLTMDWDNVHYLSFGFAEFGSKGVKGQGRHPCSSPGSRPTG